MKKEPADHIGEKHGRLIINDWKKEGRYFYFSVSVNAEKKDGSGGWCPKWENKVVWVLPQKRPDWKKIWDVKGYKVFRSEIP